MKVCSKENTCRKTLILRAFKTKKFWEKNNLINKKYIQGIIHEVLEFISENLKSFEMYMQRVGRENKRLGM